MSPDFNITLNVAQIIMLGGVIWGLARMSKSVDTHSSTLDMVTERLEYFAGVLMEMVGRVKSLEATRKR